ncbi:MAG: hypothetical protein JJU45_19075 [Acidimicrobiia bacterium]|nr:hypothetical protein [Acidimicrobiia bacterium]
MGPTLSPPRHDDRPPTSPTAEDSVGAGGTSGPQPKRFGRSSPLWSGRAAVGALLVAAAAVGTYAAARPGPPPVPPDVLVASEHVPAGTPLAEASLVASPVALPDDVLQRVLQPDADLAGLVTAVPLHAGDPLFVATVTDADRSPLHDRVELAIRLPAQDALHGRVRAGEVLAVVGAEASSPDSTLVVLSGDALVVSADVSDSTTLGATDTVDLVMALPPHDLLGVVAAHRSGGVHVVRAGRTTNLSGRGDR